MSKKKRKHTTTKNTVAKPPITRLSIIEGDCNHQLLRHGHTVLANPPRTFAELKEWFKGVDIEVIVWHHPDGRMVKIKKKDFGYKR